MMVKRKLVTVVAEASLEQRITRLVTALGAKGFTVLTGHGTGPKNQRVADLEGGNVIIETVVAKELVEAILIALERDYFSNYACTVWVSDVEVLRADRY